MLVHHHQGQQHDLSYSIEPIDKNVIKVGGFSRNRHSCSPWWWCSITETCRRYLSNVCI